jgi:hypothetical protein
LHDRWTNKQGGIYRASHVWAHTRPDIRKVKRKEKKVLTTRPMDGKNQKVGNNNNKKMEKQENALQQIDGD